MQAQNVGDRDVAVRIGILVVLVFFTGAGARTKTEQLHVVLPRNAIPAINQPSFEPAARTKSLVANELVIGVVGEREQRAYSTWQLDSHEIVNDEFEGRPIAVTW